MLTIEGLEKRADLFRDGIRKLETDLIANRGALKAVELLLDEARAGLRLLCPKCGKTGEPGVTRADFEAAPYIPTVWCEACKEPSSREEWLGEAWKEPEYATGTMHARRSGDTWTTVVHPDEPPPPAPVTPAPKPPRRPRSGAATP